MNYDNTRREAAALVVGPNHTALMPADMAKGTRRRMMNFEHLAVQHGKLSPSVGRSPQQVQVHGMEEAEGKFDPFVASSSSTRPFFDLLQEGLTANGEHMRLDIVAIYDDVKFNA